MKHADIDIFTVEETNLICIYNTASKENLLYDLQDSLPHVDDPELADTMRSVIEKLSAMTDEEFADIGFYIADDNYDGGE